MGKGNDGSKGVECLVRDTGLDFLLELNGLFHVYDNKYSYRITAYRVDVTEHRPHGIRYNMTFHDNHGTRIFAMDNKHAPPNKRRSYQGRIVEYDHTHEDSNDKGTVYVFTGAEKLTIDFFARVESILDNLKD